MVDIAKGILERKAGHFDPLKFNDQYEAALKKLVKREDAGHTIEAKPTEEDRSNVIELMDALKQSMGKRRAPTARSKAIQKRKRNARQIVRRKPVSLRNICVVH